LNWDSGAQEGGSSRFFGGGTKAEVLCWRPHSILRGEPFGGKRGAWVSRRPCDIDGKVFGYQACGLFQAASIRSLAVEWKIGGRGKKRPGGSRGDVGLARGEMSSFPGFQVSHVRGPESGCGDRKGVSAHEEKG